jgi:hypothetical protein
VDSKTLWLRPIKKYKTIPMGARKTTSINQITLLLPVKSFFRMLTSVYSHTATKISQQRIKKTITHSYGLTVIA